MKKDNELEQPFNKPEFDFFSMRKTEKMVFMLFAFIAFGYIDIKDLEEDETE